MFPQRQKAPIETAARDPAVIKRIVLHAERDEFEALERTHCVRLRLFCEQGSAVALDLGNMSAPAKGSSNMHLVTLQVSQEHLLASLDANVEVMFTCKENGQQAKFQVLSTCQDSWFGKRVEPLDECRQ